MASVELPWMETTWSGICQVEGDSGVPGLRGRRHGRGTVHLNSAGEICRSSQCSVPAGVQILVRVAHLDRLAVPEGVTRAERECQDGK